MYSKRPRSWSYLEGYMEMNNLPIMIELPRWAVNRIYDGVEGTLREDAVEAIIRTIENNCSTGDKDNE